MSADLSFSDGMYRNGIDNEQACKDVCASNETCSGIYWGFSLTTNIVGCWFQLSSQGVSDSLDNANHWFFTNCTGTVTTVRYHIFNTKMQPPVWWQQRTRQF